jgi:glutamyl-tRNA synthetase
MFEAGITKFIPRFGHLPFVMREGNKKLSKRNPESNLFLHRDRGFIPEGPLNYLALLGWLISQDRDIFTLQELCDNVDVKSVSPNPARFDQKKADSINATHLRMLDPKDYEIRVLPYLQGAGVLPSEPNQQDLELLSSLIPLIQERIKVLSETPGMIGFMFQKSSAPSLDEDGLASLPANAKEIIEAAINTLNEQAEFNTAEIQAVLSAALVEGLGEKPRNAFGPIRTAISGRRVTPLLFECMELLGKQESLARLEAFAQGR